jgi:hypothetical protein
MKPHTPGPWRVGSVSDVVVAEADEDVVPYYGGSLVAESVAPRDIPLIVAAPELLAACKTVLELLEGALISITEIDMDDVAQLRAVIAKAEGR